MKRYTILLLLMATLGASAWAASANLTTNGSSCPVATNTTALVLGLADKGGATLTVAGTWTGTISFYGTGSGGMVWTALSATPLGSSTAVTTTTGNGTWQVNASGFTNICMLSSASMTGTANVTITPGSPSAKSNGGSGGGGNANYTGTQNVLAKGSGTAHTLVDSSITDDGTHAASGANGLDTGDAGLSNANQIGNDNPGTALNELACLSSGGLLTVCPTSTAQGVMGVCVNNCGNTGIPNLCTTACPVKTHNNTTVGDWLIPSATTAGSVDDTGTSSLTAASPASQSFVADTAVTAPAVVVGEVFTPYTASGGKGGGGNSNGPFIQTNGTLNKIISNYNGTTPAAPGGNTNVTFQTSTSGNVTSISGYIPSSSSSYVNDTGTTGYQVLGTSFSTPSPACGVIVNSGTHAAETDTLVASTSQPAAGTCIYIIDDAISYLTIASSGQTIFWGNGTGNITLIPGYGVYIVSDGTNYYAQIFASGQNGQDTNTVVGGASYPGASNTVRETIYGTNIGNKTYTGASNTLIGATNTNSLTSGVGNVVIGYNQTGGALTSGNFNIMVGYASGISNPATGASNLLLGGDGTNQCGAPGDMSNYVCIWNLIYGDHSKGKVGIEGPIPSIVSNNCGSSTQGTLATGSSDSNGEVTVGTASVTSCKVTFANAWTNAPFCVVSEQTSLATVTGFGHTISTTALTVTATGGFASTKFDYMCFAGSNSANPTP